MLFITRNLGMAIGAFAVAIFLFACGGPAERLKEREREAQLATPSPTPGERPIGGSFRVEGHSPTNTTDTYTGSLTVAPKGDNYEFRWATTKGTRVGTGVQMGNVVAVSFAPTGGGKGCGVVLYKVDTINGLVEGRRVVWGELSYTTESATRTDGSGFPGTYKYTAKDSNGQDQSGKLYIKKDGEGYGFAWIPDEKANASPIIPAFGTWQGSYAAASFGGPQCGFAVYDIQAMGSLEGVWGGQKQVTFGKETASLPK